MGCLQVTFYFCLIAGSLLVIVGISMNFLVGGLGPVLLAAIGGVLFLVALIVAALAGQNKRSSSFDS
jgi:hypothetical protein